MALASEDENFHRTWRKRKRMRLLVGEKVEVKSEDDGFQGSWHPATVVECGIGFRKVKYDHLLSDDGLNYLVENVTVSARLDGQFEVQDGDLSYLNNIRPLLESTGFGRFGLYYGLCVDAHYKDAWWEGVVFDHEDGADTRNVFFPDMGDELACDIGMLRQAWDWDEYTEDWHRRRDWVFLILVEDLENDCPPMVSVKQLWYDLQEKECFSEVGKWKSSDEGLWREHLSEVINCHFAMAVEDIVASLDCVTHIGSYSLPLKEMKQVTGTEPSRVIVCALSNGKTSEQFLSLHAGSLPDRPCLELTPFSAVPSKNQMVSKTGDKISSLRSRASRKGNDSSESDDGQLKDAPFIPGLKKVWLPIENLTAEAAPGAMTDYLRCSGKSKRALYLSEKVRKHLVFLGWRIEYLKEVYMNRMRYTSPMGKVYMSLVKVCEAMSEQPEANSTTPKDKRHRPSPKVRSALLEQLNDRQKSNATQQIPDSDLVIESEYCPEAVIDWCKYVKSQVEGEIRKAKSLKARKHLSAMGWTFSYHYREDRKREMRYRSPNGRSFFSLRAACEACIKETDSLTYDIFDFSTSTENLACKTSRQLHTDWQHQSKAVVVRRQVKLEKKQKPKRIKREDDFQPASARGKKWKKSLTKHYSKSQLGSSKRAREAAHFSPSNYIPRTVLSWLIDNNAVLPRAKVEYINRKDGRPLKGGRVSREGIRCSCCAKIYSLSKFEAHAGSSIHRPSANIFLKDGRSLMECQWQILEKATSLKTEGKSDQKSEREYPKNELLCSICHYGGELMLCDKCPSSFHMTCLGLKEIPDGDWFCPSCCCALCGQGELKENTSEKDILRCYQCEHQYHLSCLKEKNRVDQEMNVAGNFFCSAKCKMIFSGLKDLLGRPFALGVDNLTWMLVKDCECDHNQQDLVDIDTLTESYSKLNVALNVMHECFEPLKDPRTKRDISEDIIFSRSAEHSRLNYQGFYTVLLEKDEELIAAATVRVFGDKAAELPLIATRFQYRQLGMCRILMKELEKKLMGLGVERLILPAVASMLSTWTGSFGFSQMTESERLQFLSYPLADFQGTILCQKFLNERSLETATPSKELLHEVAVGEGNKTNGYMVLNEHRINDDSAIPDKQINTYDCLETHGMHVTQDEQRSLSGMPLSKNDEQTEPDQQAKSHLSEKFGDNSPSLPVTGHASHEEQICSEMLQLSLGEPVSDQPSHEERTSSEMLQASLGMPEIITELPWSQNELRNINSDQQTTNSFDKNCSNGPTSFSCAALQQTSITCVTNHHPYDTGSSNSQINVKRVLGCVDRSNLIVYKRRRAQMAVCTGRALS